MKKTIKNNFNLSPLWGRKEVQFENGVRKLEIQERVKANIGGKTLTCRFATSSPASGRGSKCAFTLAEVLITLTIIGVIAALTIPNLMQKYQEQEMISRLKRVDTVISNAWQLALRENGPIEDIGPGNTDTGAEKVFNYIKPYLKVKKYCKNLENCWDKEYKTLNNTAYLNTGKIGVKGHNVSAQLYDGSLIYFWSGNDKCTESSCAAIYVDLNGKKGPNKTGFDTFKFRVWQEGITPYPATLKQGVFTLAQKEFCRYKGTSIQNGDACTYWVIRKGNMDYKYRDVSAEW